MINPAPINRSDELFPGCVARELARARARHGNITGAHDGYAKILEEVDELWDEVRRREEFRMPGAMFGELVQIAALCQRMAGDLDLMKAMDPEEVRLIIHGPDLKPAIQ
jgi:hypothetical protein